jgi:hypothetical protein
MKKAYVEGHPLIAKWSHLIVECPANLLHSIKLRREIGKVDILIVIFILTIFMNDDSDMKGSHMKRVNGGDDNNKHILIPLKIENINSLSESQSTSCGFSLASYNSYKVSIYPTYPTFIGRRISKEGIGKIKK